MKNITILLPIHILEENETIMLSKALESIEVFHNDIKLSIICPTEISKKLKDYDFGQKLEVNIIENKKLTSFQSQVNLGIENCDTEWFSILEIDDVYNETWLASITEYINAFPTVEVFLPIVRDVNSEGKFVSFTNESVWAHGFTDKLGYLNNETLLDFQNYQTSGGLFKTETVNKFGGFKDNIKLTFVYEFLLRLTYNSVNVAVVPKVGYQHVVMRENSLFWNLRHDEKEKLESDEVKFWVETAKTEYFFKNKREVNYQKP